MGPWGENDGLVVSPRDLLEVRKLNDGMKGALQWSGGPWGRGLPAERAHGFWGRATFPKLRGLEFFQVEKMG